MILKDKIYSSSLSTLSSIAFLENGWDGYKAPAFSLSQIGTAYNILSDLEGNPRVYPTGFGAIQIEYGSDEKEYLEFEVYPEYIRSFQVDPQGREKASRIDEWTRQSAKHYKKFLYA